MRLLSRSEGKFSNWVIQDFPADVPFYAVMSHTWDDKDQEVTFEDIEDGTTECDDQSKTGFDKLRFCAEKAEADGLRYFWIDTCCIKKSDSTELQRSLNSMFFWYQRAVRCYVLLSDVSLAPQRRADSVEAFRRSNWFKRGWTLQELLAPNSVVFYSKEGARLGDKRELEKGIADVTKIPTIALQGAKLSLFSKKERFAWAEHRVTTVPEDAAYCLLGIFNVRMYPSYADGIYSQRRKEALFELNRMIDLAPPNAPESHDVIRIGGASYANLSELNPAQLQYLDEELEAYTRWLVDIFPVEGNISGSTSGMTRLSQTAGKKLKELLGNFGVDYEDLSRLETTVTEWREPWARFRDKSYSDQVRVEAIVENRWYWTKKNEDVYMGITAARTLIDLMIWRGKWTAS